MKLPKPGTSIDDLKCPKCGLALKDTPKPCPDAECPQKPKEANSGS